jgi:hypothetical protein
MAVILASSNEDLLVILGAIVAGGLTLQWQSQRLEAEPGEVVAECADGSVIGAWRDRVRRRPGRRREERARTEARLAEVKPRWRRPLLTDNLRAGDLRFARVRQGREGEPSWIVEGLHPDRDLTSIRWEFVSQDAARRALELLERCIVRPAWDRGGATVRVTEADFDAVQARERLELEEQVLLDQQDEAANARA